MTSPQQYRRNALRQARRWAKNGNRFMTQNFINQAESVLPLSQQQLQALNKMLIASKGN